jgi:hypothetical protein
MNGTKSRILHFEEEIKGMKTKIPPKNLCLVCVPVRVEHVAWKLSTMEEWHPDQGCLFWRVDYTSRGHNPKKLS